MHTSLPVEYSKAIFLSISDPTVTNISLKEARNTRTIAQICHFEFVHKKHCFQPSHTQSRSYLMCYLGEVLNVIQDCPRSKKKSMIEFFLNAKGVTETYGN